MIYFLFYLQRKVIEKYVCKQVENDTRANHIDTQFGEIRHSFV